MYHSDRKKGTTLYNIMIPIWLLVFWPSYLWLLLIPANYIIDRLVLAWSLKGQPDVGAFCRKHTWKICLVGFFCDFVGCLLLLVTALGADGSGSGGVKDFLENTVGNVMYNPYEHPLAILMILVSIALAGLLIYLIDRPILVKAGLTAEAAKKSARMLAVFTAPYLFLIPSSLIYGDFII